MHKKDCFREGFKMIAQSPAAQIPILQNQIRQLYLWIHPGNNPVGMGIYDSWRELIELLQFEPTLALLETSNHENQTPEKHHPDDPHLPWNSRAPYGWKNEAESAIQKSKDETMKDDDRTCRQKVEELESLAHQLLGDRYQVWPHGNFVEANKAPHLSALREMFRVDPRRMHAKQWRILKKSAAASFFQNPQ